MLFSVLIAHYNNAIYLATAIESVLKQSYTQWEIVLVDDGSTDHFEKVIARFDNDSRIRVFRNSVNQGCGYSKRRCAELATGQLMGFLDPDDALDPEALTVMVRSHLENPGFSLLYSNHFICDPSLRVSRIAEYIRPLPPGTPYLLLGDGSIHLFATFRKDAYLKTEGIQAENKKAVDKDLYYKLEETGPVLFVNKPLYYYRIHPGSISNLGQESKATLAHYVIAKKACKRRIDQLKKAPSSQASLLIRQYRTRYYKLSIFEGFKTKNWPGFLFSLLVFPFVGGAPNMVSYAIKFVRQGTVVFKRSFIENYQIKI